MTIYLGQTERLTGDIRLVADHGNRQFRRQTGDEIGPDRRRFGGIGRCAVHHKQHAVSLFDLLPGALNPDALHFVAGLTQTGGVDDMQRHAINMNMLTQHVTGGACDIRDDGGVTACQRIQQARFACIRPARNHHFHPFTQQAALTRFGTDGIQVADHRIQLRFDSAVREEIDLLIREVDSGFNIDPQVSKCFHKMIDTGGENALQGVHCRTRRLLRAGINQVSNRFGLRQIELVIQKRTL